MSSESEFGIYRADVLVAWGFGSEYAANFELDHRLSPGGVWDGVKGPYKVRRITD